MVQPPRTRRGKAADALANTLSSVASPPILAAAMMAVAASVDGTVQAWRFAALYIGLAIATPILYLIWLLRRGTVSDIDVQIRGERWRPLIAAQLGMGIALALFIIQGAPPLMIALAGGLLAYTALAFGITLWWKISMHAAAAAAIAALVVTQVGAPAFPLLAGIPLMAWARIRLKRHTLAQTVAGAALGSAALVAALVWLPVA
jgi:membrane-associated phospholipid phosphatase